MSVNTVTLLGTLTAGPQGVCEGGFPAGVLQLPFGLAGSCPGAGTKPSAKRFWSTIGINTPSPAFITLDGVGAGQSVTRANLLYLRTIIPMKIRLTMADPAGGPDIVSILTPQGLVIVEFQDSGYLKLLEAQGVGSIELLVSGNE